MSLHMFFVDRRKCGGVNFSQPERVSPVRSRREVFARISPVLFFEVALRADGEGLDTKII
jgi:hypothetical protein